MSIGSTPGATNTNAYDPDGLTRYADASAGTKATDASSGSAERDAAALKALEDAKALLEKHIPLSHTANDPAGIVCNAPPSAEEVPFTHHDSPDPKQEFANVLAVCEATPKIECLRLARVAQLSSTEEAFLEGHGDEVLTPPILRKVTDARGQVYTVIESWGRRTPPSQYGGVIRFSQMVVHTLRYVPEIEGRDPLKPGETESGIQISFLHPDQEHWDPANPPQPENAVASLVMGMDFVREEDGCYMKIRPALVEARFKADQVNKFLAKGITFGLFRGVLGAVASDTLEDDARLTMKVDSVSALREFVLIIDQIALEDLQREIAEAEKKAETNGSAAGQ